MKTVAINGYGTIGKRVADAVAAQDDMKIIGVSKTRPNYEARTAVEEKGYPLYIGIPEREQLFKDAGIEFVYGDRDGAVVIDVDKQGEDGYDFLDAVGFYCEGELVAFLARCHLHDMAQRAIGHEFIA